MVNPDQMAAIFPERLRSTGTAGGYPQARSVARELSNPSALEPPIPEAGIRKISRRATSYARLAGGSRTSADVMGRRWRLRAPSS